MDAAFQQVVATVLQLGFPGVVIFGLAYWLWNREKRINDLTDKMMIVTEQSTKSASEMAAAMNRLTDSLLRGKTE
jgi:hypothetical protein